MLSDNFGIFTSIIFLTETSRFAILKIYTDNDPTSKGAQRFDSEVSILSKFHGFMFNNIIYKKKKTSSTSNFIVLELLPNGNLSEYLRSFKVQMPDKMSNEFERFKIIHQLAFAIKILQENNIMHRDIKPENTFIGENGCLYLGDLSFSRLVSKVLSTFPGTPGYIAPEVLQLIEYDLTSDIYSFGASVFYIVFGERPFHLEKSLKKVISIAKTTYILKFYQDNSDKINKNLKKFSEGNNLIYFDIIRDCMKLEPKDRPTMVQILEKLELYGNNKFPDQFKEFVKNLKPSSEIINGSKEQLLNQSNSSFSNFCLALYYFNIEKNINKGYNFLCEAQRLGSTFAEKLHKMNLDNNLYSKIENLPDFPKLDDQISLEFFRSLEVL